MAALGVSALPALAVPAADVPAPVSAWGPGAPKAQMPQVKVGSNTPVAAEAEAPVSAEVAAWRTAQKERAEAGTRAGAAARSSAAVLTYVPEGQGAVPWHQISDFRITDSLVARVNYSNGNLMLAATDFDVAGVGQTLRLSRTYNSLDAPWGKVSQRWWQEYERYAQIFASEVVIYDASGGAVRFTEESNGTFTTPKGYSGDLKKNSDGTYTLTDRKSGSKDTYDANGTLTKVTDKNNGAITITQHDEGGEQKGFKVTETRPGRWVDLLKTNASQWQAKDHTGRTAVYDLNPAGDVVKTTDTEGKPTQFGYDSSRRLTKITTPEGRVTVFTYDDQNRVTSMLRATELNGSGHTGPTWTYTYDASSPSAAGTTKVTDPEQHSTSYKHDGDGQVTDVTDALTHNRTKTFDANRNVKSASDAMGVGGTGANVTTYGWDSRNNPTSAKLPTGATSAATGYQTIAGSDLPGSITTPDDEKTDYTYDTAGNTKSVAVEGTGGGNQSFEYNPATPTCQGFQGQRCKATTKMTSTKSVSTTFTYDAQGNLKTVKAPAPLGTTTYTYDALGRTESVQDARGVKVIYTYDNRDRVTQVDSSNYAKVTYSYDGDGNLKQRSDGTGVISYDFDPLSRETIRTLQDGSQTVLTYTPAGNVDTYQDPAGLTDYTWNEVNKLKSLKDPKNKITSYEYDKNDIRTTTTYPGNTVQTVTPDKSGRPEKIKATSPKGTLVDLAYDYAYTGKDEAKKDGGKIRTSTDAVSGYKTSYTYDSAGRFSYAKEEKGTTLRSSWQYCYDLAGNLTSQGVASGCPGGTTYAVNDAQQITSKNGSATNWSYDKIGNETAGASTPEGTRTGETWSDYSQMTSVTVAGKTYAGQYGSTDQSERIKLGDTFFHNGPIGLAGTSTAGIDTGFNREPEGTLNSMTRGGKNYYYLTDALGSVVAVADETGTKVNSYGYSPRGVPRSTTSETVAQPYRFAGGYQDPTGLYHFAARYYDPNIGRFTTPDPSGQEQNPYLYAEGDPVNRIDPNGLLSWGDGLGIAGDLITGISHLKDGDSTALWGDVLGVVAGGVAGMACESAVAASAPATLGGSLGASAGCYAISWSVGSIASNAVG
ncbi:RHS repeat-associated core domain-containing protein [Streptomyces laculatispora]|uniref:RHS repeat-associated core domain-containing protein n=2 Tax=Streptomyces laculatispora TaxID=887464 RepID=A0ABY9IE52_9ACTN|nr:RHS repeat-associated core domain-containing protein [Streptomyces laculatispora]WLQ45218.1 RHS repeat-associated core domain-containing protein [Streptomyces laculatispora]